MATLMTERRTRGKKRFLSIADAVRDAELVLERA